MNITYLHHSGFLVETERFYYLFDYEKGQFPRMEPGKTIFILSSHGHSDHYHPGVFSLLARAGMADIRPVLSDDIPLPPLENTLHVAPGREYDLEPGVKLTTFRSTDLGVAFLVEEGQTLIYHAGDLNDWVWEEETDDYNTRMTQDYREQIRLLEEKLRGRPLDAAFVVLDPRQEKDYDRGLCWFLAHIDARKVYPMHYWDRPAIMDTFLKNHPQYQANIQKTE